MGANLKNSMRFVASIALGSSLLFALAACGGGGGNSSPTVNTVPLTVSVDSSVPAATSSAVTMITTLFGDIPAGQPLMVPSGNIGNENFLIGLDSAGNPLLAAFQTGNADLSVDSTAQALVRIAADASVLPDGITPAQFAAAVMASSNYQALLTAITSSLTSGTSPVQSISVIDLVWQVALDATASLVATSANPGAAAKDATPVATALPYYFFNVSAIDKIWITDQPASPNVVLNNRTLLAYQVTSTVPGSAPAVTIANPLKETFGQLFAYYGGSESMTPVVGATDSTFTVGIDQSDTTEFQNGTQAVTQAVSSFTKLASLYGGISDDAIGKCVTTITDDFVNAPEFSAALAQGTGQAWLDYLNNVVAPNVGVKVLGGCEISVTPTQVLKLLMPSWQKIWDALEFSKSAFATGTIFNEVSASFGQSYTVQLCKASGTFAPSCLTLTIMPSNPTVSVGQTTTLTVTATNGSGTTVPKPTGLNWKSSSDSIASVDQTGIVTGVSAGSTNITVTDPISGATASAMVTVTSLPECTSDITQTQQLANGALTISGTQFAFPIDGGGNPTGGPSISAPFSASLIIGDQYNSGNVISGGSPNQGLNSFEFSLFAYSSDGNSVVGTYPSGTPLSITQSKAGSESFSMSGTVSAIGPDPTGYSDDLNSYQYSLSGIFTIKANSGLCVDSANKTQYNTLQAEIQATATYNGVSGPVGDGSTPSFSVTGDVSQIYSTQISN